MATHPLDVENEEPLYHERMALFAQYGRISVDPEVVHSECNSMFRIRPQTVADFIIHFNDVHQWSFVEIAEWLDDLKIPPIQGAINE